MKKTMLQHEQICNLIPHAGDMCLLDVVQSWDEQTIICLSETHQRKSNPLRNNEILPMSSLIEYGAQAMAVHGGLLAEAEGKRMQAGYLAALRDVHMANGDLFAIENELVIEARRVTANGGNMIYMLRVTSANQELVRGRATVVARFDGEESSL